MIVRAFTLFLTVFALLCAAPAFAACTTPDGVASQTRFDFATHKMLYCDGSNWIQIPSSGTGKGCVQDGVVVPSGVSYNFFSAQSHANCASIQQSRLCTDGVLGGTGTFQYAFCSTADTTPDAFSFTDQTGVAVSTVTNSNIVQITGITAQTTITFGGGGGLFRVCGDATCSANPTWNNTSVGGAIGNGEYLQVRVTSSASYSTAYNLVVNVGGVSDTWTVTTGANDITPDAFSFADATDQPRNSLVTPTPQTVTITGITSSVTASVSGQGSPQISINGGAWTTSGNITNGQSLAVRLTSAGTFNTLYTATITVGTATDSWTVRTNVCSVSMGVAFGGYCWVLGAASASCDTACASKGGCDLAGTLVAGSGGSNMTCEQVLGALGRANTVSTAANAQGVGCISQGSNNNRVSNNATTCAATAAAKQRACACNG